MERYVLLVGANSDIGRAIYDELKCANYHVLLGVSSDISESKLRREYPDLLSCEVFRIDLESYESIMNGFQAVFTSIGGMGLHALINCAGIAYSGPGEMLPEKFHRKQFEVNYFGSMRLLQTFLPLLRVFSGRYIVIGSNFCRMPGPYLAAYGASKAASESYLRSLRLELMPHQIPVSIINPGLISSSILRKTVLTARFVYSSFSQSQQERYCVSWSNTINSYLNHMKPRIHPAKVAQVVHKVLISEKPKFRYCVGFNTYLLDLLALLPEHLADYLFFKWFHVYPEPMKADNIFYMNTTNDMRRISMRG